MSTSQLGHNFPVQGLPAGRKKISWRDMQIKVGLVEGGKEKEEGKGKMLWRLSGKEQKKYWGRLKWDALLLSGPSVFIDLSKLLRIPRDWVPFMSDPALIINELETLAYMGLGGLSNCQECVLGDMVEGSGKVVKDPSMNLLHSQFHTIQSKTNLIE